MADTEKPLVQEEKEAEIMPAPETEKEQKTLADAVVQKTEVGAAAPTAEKSGKFSVKKLVIAGVSAVVLITAIVLFVIYGVPAIRYSNGVKAYDAGDYAQAVEIFAALEDYKESDEYLEQAALGVHYTNAGSKVQAGEYKEAIEEYKNAKNFQDSKKLLKETYVLYGDSLVSQGKYDDAVREYRHASESGKIKEAYDLKGEALFREKQYVQAAEAFTAAENHDRYLDCGLKLVEEQKDYATALTILGEETDPKASAPRSYANAMLSLKEEDYQSAVDFLTECSGYLDADTVKTESVFLLAEKCLHEGYLNKAKRLYTELPDGYTQGNVVVADRIELLNQNAKLLSLVGKWNATDTYYRVQADSTTSSYYYYWYQDSVRLGTVTVTCPYNEDGTFTIRGTATYPSYQNFSSNSSKLRTDMETFRFSTSSTGNIPYQMGSSSTTKLSFSGNQFDLQYKYINKTSNVYWHYTFTSKVKYGTRTVMAEDR